MHYDAIIIGARCAGAATAMLLARGGKRVLLVDRQRPGTDTMSTHALMRGAVIQLDRWGLLGAVLAAGTPEVTSTRFTYGDERIDVAIRPSHGTRGLVAPRRYLLDRLLAEAAEAAGAHVLYDASFVDVLRDDQGRVVGAVVDGPGRRLHVRADLVIGADGRRSTVARRVAAETKTRARNAAGSVYAYFVGLPDEGYRWFYREGIGAGAIPTNEGAHCVFVSAAPAEVRSLIRQEGHLRALHHLAASTSPSLSEELRAGAPVSEPIVFAGEPGFIKQSSGPGWALVGDAGYFKDPLTAHGITDAFRDADILSRTILADLPLSVYEATRDAASAELFDLTDRIAGLGWTLSELKAMHLRLNEVMKAEQAMIVGETAAAPVAA